MENMSLLRRNIMENLYLPKRNVMEKMYPWVNQENVTSPTTVRMLRIYLRMALGSPFGKSI